MLVLLPTFTTLFILVYSDQHLLNQCSTATNIPLHGLLLPVHDESISVKAVHPTLRMDEISDPKAPLLTKDLVKLLIKDCHESCNKRLHENTMAEREFFDSVNKKIIEGLASVARAVSRNNDSVTERVSNLEIKFETITSYQENLIYDLRSSLQSLASTPLTCSICEEVFTSQGLLSIHILSTHTHRTDNPGDSQPANPGHAQPPVKTGFLDPVVVTNQGHIQQVSNNSYDNCTACSNHSTPAHTSPEHIDNQHAVVEDLTWSFPLHMPPESVHTNKMLSDYQCRMCEKTFLNPVDLADHTQQHHTDLYTGSYFAEHDENTHARSSVYYCESCGITIPSEHRKSKHMCSDHGMLSSQEGAYNCVACDKYFHSSREIAFHTSFWHSANPSPSLHCNHCTSVFNDMLLLNIHIRECHREPSIMLQSSCNVEEIADSAEVTSVDFQDISDIAQIDGNDSLDSSDSAQVDRNETLVISSSEKRNNTVYNYEVNKDLQA